MPSRLPEAHLVNPDPAALLPHRYPFLLLDAIISREPGVAASATTRITFDVVPFPRVLMVEAMAQLAGVASGCGEGVGGFLATIDHAELLGDPLPGDTLLIAVRVVKGFGRLFLLEGEVSVGGRRLATATLTLGIGAI